MSVKRKAERIAGAARSLMPQAVIGLDHSETDWGCSSYVTISFAVPFRPKSGARLQNRWIREEARVSDHKVGMNRFWNNFYGCGRRSRTTGWFNQHVRPDDWQLWLNDLHRTYLKGGLVPGKASPLPLFDHAGVAVLVR